MINRADSKVAVLVQILVSTIKSWRRMEENGGGGGEERERYIQIDVNVDVNVDVNINECVQLLDSGSENKTLTDKC